jgi:hypothetical protein
VNLRTRWRPLVAYGLVVLSAFLAGYLSARAADHRARLDLEAVSVAAAQQTRESGLAGCQRGQAGYAANVRGWREARHRNLTNADDRHLPTSARLAAEASASVYKTVIESLDALRVECGAAWPPVRADVVKAAIRRIAAEQNP